MEIWAENEALLGLKPIVRRVWAVKGRRPEAFGRTKYEWPYVYGFGHPASGRSLELLPPAANTDWMRATLSEFARWANLEDGRLMDHPETVRGAVGFGWATANG